jgi:hypothetical protein
MVFNATFNKFSVILRQSVLYQQIEQSQKDHDIQYII